MEFVTATLGLTGCHRGQFAEQPELGGVRFVAYSQLTGAARDTVTIRVYAFNRTSHVRELQFGDYGHGYQVVAYAEHTAGRPRWDFTKWLAADDSVKRVAGGPEQVCLLNLVEAALPAGKSMMTDRFILPVRMILGDSLAAGRYRLAIRSGVRGAPRHLVPAGQLDIPQPIRYKPAGHAE